MCWGFAFALNGINKLYLIRLYGQHGGIRTHEPFFQAKGRRKLIINLVNKVAGGSNDKSHLEKGLAQSLQKLFAAT